MSQPVPSSLWTSSPIVFPLLLWLALFLFTGCNSQRASQSLDVLLGPTPELASSPAFHGALASETPASDREKARIDYLLERVGKSPYKFIRNGGRYTGKRAQAHLRWKYFRNRSQVRTAEEFIDRIATRSKTSGQPYLVELVDRTRYSLRTLLMHELNFLKRVLEAKQAAVTDTAEET